MKFVKTTAIAMGLVAASSGAFAETKNFEGLGVYVSASAVSSSMKLEGGGLSVNGLGNNSFATDIGADYGFKISESGVVLLGATYGLADPTALEVSGSQDFDDQKLKMKQRWSLYAAPGVTFGSDSLLYAKLAYVSAKPDADDSRTHGGVGFGAGARFFLNKEVFLNVEFMRNNYGKKNYGDADISGGSTAGTVAIGYKF